MSPFIHSLTTSFQITNYLKYFHHLSSRKIDFDSGLAPFASALALKAGWFLGFHLFTTPHINIANREFNSIIARYVEPKITS